MRVEHRPQIVQSRLTNALIGSIVLLLLLSAAPARAAFTGVYALDNFTLLNTNADGTQSSTDGVTNLTLTGGNNGTGLPGSTYFLTLAPVPAFVSFSFVHTTDDDPLIPELDISGYLVGGSFWSLSGTAIAGTGGFAVAAGEGFGFGIETADNWGGSAYLTITDFEVQAVPEPGTCTILVFALTGLITLRLARRSGL